MRKEQRIEGIDLFRACRSRELQWIARSADELDIGAGSMLARAGGTVREFIVVLDGVAVSDDGTVYGPGSHLGEFALVADEPAATTVEALTDMRILVFDSRGFWGLLERMPSVARKLMKRLVVQQRVATAAREVRAAA
jgi:CRP-like cAMP-binding protein